MADNANITPGSGKTVLADELTDATLGTGIAQFVKLMDGTLDSSNKGVITSRGALQVEGVASGTSLGVKGTGFAITSALSVPAGAYHAGDAAASIATLANAVSA